jgi:hypothetical protein
VAHEFAHQRDEGFEIDAIDLIGARSHVIMAIRMPRPREVDGVQFDVIYNVFAIEDGSITGIEDYTDRAEALAAAGLA